MKTAKPSRSISCSKNKSVHAKERKNAKPTRMNSAQLTLSSPREQVVLLTLQFHTNQCHLGLIISQLHQDLLFLVSNPCLLKLEIKFQVLARLVRTLLSRARRKVTSHRSKLSSPRTLRKLRTTPTSSDERRALKNKN